MERRGAYLDRLIDIPARDPGAASALGVNGEWRVCHQDDRSPGAGRNPESRAPAPLSGYDAVAACMGPRTLRRRLQSGDNLYRSGDLLKSFYAVRSGCFKSLIADAEGREQVSGFPMRGDVLGIDGLATGRYASSAIALEDSAVDVVHCTTVERAAREHPVLQRRLLALVASETLRANGTLMLLGSLRARERLAAFLLDLSQRLLQNGESASELRLRMTRDEIGSYLGLQIETVSRLFSAFRTQGLIDVHKKDVCIRDFRGLEKVLRVRGRRQA